MLNSSLPALHQFSVYTSSLTLSAICVAIIFLVLGSPRTSDSVNFAACSNVTFAGMGASKGSTTASISTGPLAIGTQCPIQNRAALFRIVNTEADSAACLRKFHEINGRQIHAEFRIAEKDHLLPLDLAERIVL